MSDRISAILILVFSFVYGLEAYRLKSGFGSDSVGPRGFPLILAALLALLGLILLFKPSTPKNWPDGGSLVNIGLALLSFVIYAYLLLPIGFIASTTLETGFLSQRFGAKYWQAALLGIGSSLFLYALFVYALQIPLPTGKLFK